MMSTAAASLIALQFAAGALGVDAAAPALAAAAAQATAAANAPAGATDAKAAAPQAQAAAPTAADAMAARGATTSADTSSASSTITAADVPANWADAPAARPALIAPVAPSAPAATSKTIRDAVRDAIAEGHAADLATDREAPATRRYTTQAPPDRFQAFAEQFDDARVPDCLHSEGLKRQPTSIGPFGVGGLLAFPFVAIAKLRGKCN